MTTETKPRPAKAPGCGDIASLWGEWRSERKRPTPAPAPAPARKFRFRRAKASISEAKTKLQVIGLRIRIARMQKELRRRPTISPITSLAPLPFQILQPILSVIRRDNGAFIASFADANINASGESEEEAYDMLKEALVSAFCLLSEHENELGKETGRQLAVLREFIREK